MNEYIRDYVVEQLLDGRAVNNDENLLLSGLVDSLGVMRLVRHIETHFGISVPPEDVTITHFMTIDSISAYVARHQGASN